MTMYPTLPRTLSRVSLPLLFFYFFSFQNRHFLYPFLSPTGFINHSRLQCLMNWNMNITWNKNEMKERKFIFVSNTSDVLYGFNCNGMSGSTMDSCRWECLAIEKLWINKCGLRNSFMRFCSWACHQVALFFFK